MSVVLAMTHRGRVAAALAAGFLHDQDPFRTLMVGGSLPLRKLTHRVAGALWPPNIEQLETEASAPSVK
jgi:hypothetical protein